MSRKSNYSERLPLGLLIITQKGIRVQCCHIFVDFVRNFLNFKCWQLIKNFGANSAKRVQAASLQSLQGIRWLGWVLTVCSCPVLTDSPSIPCPGSHGKPPGAAFVPAPEAAGGPEGNRHSAVPHRHEISLGRQEGAPGEVFLASWEWGESRPFNLVLVKLNGIEPHSGLSSSSPENSLGPKFSVL